jgi:hypothetical protein
MEGRTIDRWNAGATIAAVCGENVSGTIISAGAPPSLAEAGVET